MNMVILGYSIPFWKCQSCAIGARPCIALSSTRHIPWKATSCPRPCHGFPQAPPIRSGVWRPTSNPRVLGGFPGSTSQKSAWKWAKMECSCILKTNQTYRQQHAHDPMADQWRMDSGYWWRSLCCYKGLSQLPPRVHWVRAHGTAILRRQNLEQGLLQQAPKTSQGARTWRKVTKGLDSRWIGRENTTLAGSQTKHTVVKPHPTVPWCLFRPLGQLLQGKVWWYSDSLPKTCDEINGPVTIGRVHQQFDLSTQRRRMAEPSHLGYP